MRKMLAAWPIVVIASINVAWAQAHTTHNTVTQSHAAHGSLESSAAVAGGSPANPNTTVPPASYRSPLLGFRMLNDETVGGWRDANDAVGRIGGWRAYAREAVEGSAPANIPAKPNASVGAHGGHRAQPPSRGTQ